MNLIRLDVLIKVLGEELVDEYEGMQVIHPAYFHIMEKLGFPQPPSKKVN